MAARNPIPVVDIFAGPGGLGEGFSAATDVSGNKLFNIALSIEKDPIARRTLRLRSFYRAFESRDAIPTEYFRHLQGELDANALFEAYPEQATSSYEEAWCTELGVVKPQTVDRRIRKAVSQSDDWLLIGGPPCQAYSLVGRSRNGKKKNQEDTRHFLYREYLRILKKHRPVAFVLENVKGLLSAHVGHQRIVSRIFEDLSGAGYDLHTLNVPASLFPDGIAADPADFVLRFEDHGVPQARHRLIIVGLRSDARLSAPRPLQRVQPRATLVDALHGLPMLRSRLSRRSGTDSPNRWGAAIRRSVGGAVLRQLDEQQPKVADLVRSNLAFLDFDIDVGGEFVRHPVGRYRRETDLWSWWHQENLKGVCNHSARSHMAADLGRYFFAACFAAANHRSPSLADFPPALVPRHKNIDRRKKTQIFADRFRVQLRDRPSTTVTSHISKDGHYFIHPDPRQCRSLTVREAARLQTFPDDYFFMGGRTAQYHQVGNAVPPYAAWQIACAVAGSLGVDRSAKDSDDGHPDTSSPKLEHVAHQGA